MAEAQGQVVGRVAESDEWPTLLAETALAGVTLPPDTSVVVVVEVDGQLAACWAAINTIHVEGLEIRPEFAGHAGVARALMATMAAELTAQGVVEVLTLAATPEVEKMIAQVGGRRVPGSVWVLPVRS
jgi:ribosomal protein S18 acetylase RimI-like enzyme